MIRGMEKKQLRRALVAQRSDMDAVQREKCGRMACERLLQSALWERASGVLLTVSTPQELDTMPLLQAALGQGKPLFLPKCSGEKMSFYQLSELADLRPGAFGLWEPPEKAPLVPSPDLLLVAPAVACDRQGFRLGMGGGYYDRFLKGFEGTTVCLVFEELLFECLPKEAHDVPVQVVMTQSRDIDAASLSNATQETVWPHGHTAPLGDALD